MKRNNFSSTPAVAALALAMGAFGLIPAHAVQENWVSKAESTKPKSAVSALGNVDWDHWDDMKDLLSQICWERGVFLSNLAVGPGFY